MLATVDMASFDGVNRGEFEVMWKNKDLKSTFTSEIVSALTGV
jgi:hypothetical protein